MLKYNSRPSELCILRELFYNSEYCRDNGTTITGGSTPANGLPLSGSAQYASRPLNDCVLNGKTALTFERWFIPTVAADSGTLFYIFDTSAGAGARIYLRHNADNTLAVSIGGTALSTITYASYSAYWYTNKPNHIAICAASGSTLVYLNNNLVGTLATAWAQTVQPATLYFGTIYSAGNYFTGTDLGMSIYATKWSADEVEDAYKKQTFREMQFCNAVVHLPGKSIYANTGDGVMLGTDMDMEADNVTAWTAGASATLTKEAGTRTGGSGSKVLRIAYNGVNNPTAGQGILTASKYYRITGWMRGDGTAVPRIYAGSGIYIAGTSSTTWQSIDTVFPPAGSVNLTLYCGATAAGWCEFDDITVQEIDLFTPNLGTGADVKVGDSGLYGVTLAQNNGFVYDGSNSLLNYGSDPVGTSAGTFAALVNLTGYGESNSGIIFANGRLSFNADSTNKRMQFSSDEGTYANSATNSLALGVWNTVICTRTAANPSLVNFYINGVLSGTANQSSGVPTAGSTNLIIGNNNGRSGTTNGTIKYPTIWTNFVATPCQVREIHAKLLSMLNK